MSKRFCFLITVIHILKDCCTGYINLELYIFLNLNPLKSILYKIIYLIEVSRITSLCDTKLNFHNNLLLLIKIRLFTSCMFRMSLSAQVRKYLQSLKRSTVL